MLEESEFGFLQLRLGVCWVMVVERLLEGVEDRFERV